METLSDTSECTVVYLIIGDNLPHPQNNFVACRHSKQNPAVRPRMLRGRGHIPWFAATVNPSRLGVHERRSGVCRRRSLCSRMYHHTRSAAALALGVPGYIVALRLCP